MTHPYVPTEQQEKVICHGRSAFVTACPGAGKTRTMVERARKLLLEETKDRRGVAFLSFTNAAIEQLETRLRAFSVLPTPLFPSFVGTFDRFLWQFLISPFELQGCEVPPRLVPDKEEWQVQPYDGAQSLPLACFDRATGKVDAASAKQHGFDVEERNVKPYETLAGSISSNARRRGQMDFQDVRMCVRERLADTAFAGRVGNALAARFREIVVDEAQDCNPSDLAVVHWLRQSGISVKVICDPHQSIYQFRGGITAELWKFAELFTAADRLPMSGNFRSTPAICAAIVALRPPNARSNPDRAVGLYEHDQTPIHLIAYAGQGVSSEIGKKFLEILKTLQIPANNAPVLASTRASAANAIGQPAVETKRHMTLLLAEAAMNYHFAFAVGNRRDALVNLHRVISMIQGRISNLGEYHAYLASEGIEDGRWRPPVIALANGLRFNHGETPEKWLSRARELIAATGIVGLNINQRLKSHADLKSALAGAPIDSPPARTIHSAKGMEFPAVCVVMTPQTAGPILDFLGGKASLAPEDEEDVRKIYVAASRAERLLAIAVPMRRAGQLFGLLSSAGSRIEVHKIGSSTQASRVASHRECSLFS